MGCILRLSHIAYGDAHHISHDDLNIAQLLESARHAGNADHAERALITSRFWGGPSRSQERRNLPRGKPGHPSHHSMTREPHHIYCARLYGKLGEAKCLFPGRPKSFTSAAS